MRAFQTFALQSATIALIAASSIVLNSQDTGAGATTTSFAASISMKQEVYPGGQKPWVTLTTKNISKRAVDVRPDGLDWCLHVEGEKGEPQRTLYHRQMRGEPGVPALAGGGPSRFPINVDGEKPYEGIPPAGSDVREFDLTVLYDLTPGQYTVYMDVKDTTGVWMRTNTVHFEIQPPTL
jgi:hypothetical protein